MEHKQRRQRILLDSSWWFQFEQDADGWVTLDRPFESLAAARTCLPGLHRFVKTMLYFAESLINIPRRSRARSVE